MKAIDVNFWKGKRVLLTGHTGFKGSWMALWLETMGASVTGFGLSPETDPSLFTMLGPLGKMRSVIGDVRDVRAVGEVVRDTDPEIVIHMAAQALVRRSYAEPIDTVSTNVMGTVNVLEALRGANSLKVALVVTSDKVYRNVDDGQAFAEDAALGGDDPYSASKACQEIIAHSWAKSFYMDGNAVIATARAGNVIGGGDFSEDRLIPDIYRAVSAGQAVTLRNPEATRPWQHVLDLNAGYLMYIEALAKASSGVPSALNFGPQPGTAYTVGAISQKMMESLGVATPTAVVPARLKEKTLLSVDAAKAEKTLGWQARLDVDEAIRLTAEWYGAFLNGADAKAFTLGQIKAYEAVL